MEHIIHVLRASDEICEADFLGKRYDPECIMRIETVEYVDSFKILIKLSHMLPSLKLDDFY